MGISSWEKKIEEKKKLKNNKNSFFSLFYFLNFLELIQYYCNLL